MFAYRIFYNGRGGTSTVIAWDNYEHTSSSWTETVIGHFAASSLPTKSTSLSTEGLSQARTAALIGLMHDYENKKGKLFQSGVALGEYKETVGMVRKSGETLFKSILTFVYEAKNLILAFKHVNPGQIDRSIPRMVAALKKLEKQIVDLYLEYRYGWKPLVADLNDAVNALNEATLRKPFDYVHIKGRGQNQVDLGTTFTGIPVPSSFSSPSHYSNVGTVNTVLDHRYKFYGICATELGDNSLAHTFGFDDCFGQFLPTIWELIPYSFIVDYFTNLGDVIQALSTRIRGCRWMNESYQSVSRTKVIIPGFTGNEGYTQHIFSGDSAIGTATHISRQRVLDPTDILDGVQLQFKCPDWFSTQWVNLAALAASHFLSHK